MDCCLKFHKFHSYSHVVQWNKQGTNYRMNELQNCFKIYIVGKVFNLLIEF